MKSTTRPRLGICLFAAAMLCFVFDYVLVLSTQVGQTGMNSATITHSICKGVTLLGLVVGVWLFHGARQPSVYAIATFTALVVVHVAVDILKYDRGFEGYLMWLPLAVVFATAGLGLYILSRGMRTLSLEDS